VGYWLFNEGAGSQAQDLSPYENHGTLVGPTWVGSNRGAVLGFNGGDGDYVDCGDIDAIDNATKLSVCAWVYHDNITDDQYIATKRGGNDDDGFLLIRDDVGSVSGRTDIYTVLVLESTGAANRRIESAQDASPLQTWTHVCFTYEENIANGLRLYINGVEDANSPVSTVGFVGIDAQGGSFLVGVNFEFGVGFDGKISEVLNYNRAPSAAEIMQHYQNPYAMSQQQQVWRYFVPPVVAPAAARGNIFKSPIFGGIFQ
jgi:hypothetical protein